MTMISALSLRNMLSIRTVTTNRARESLQLVVPFGQIATATMPHCGSSESLFYCMRVICILEISVLDLQYKFIAKQVLFSVSCQTDESQMDECQTDECQTDECHLDEKF